MAIPTYDATMLPSLRVLIDGAEHDVRDARERLASEFRLSDEERQQLLPSGRIPIFDSRGGWGKTYLERREHIRSKKPQGVEQELWGLALAYT